MNRYYLFCVLFIFSCVENNPRGVFLREEVDSSESKIVIDSIWENYKIKEIRLKEYGLSHKYHFVDSLEPFEYSVEYKGETLMKFDSIHKEESYKTGSSIHVLSSEIVTDSINVKLLTARPYTMAECFYVNILRKYEDETVDTILVDYKPRGDVIIVRMSEEQVASELYVESFLCENKLDRLSFSLGKTDNEKINTGE